jgi:hypothetical protein
MQFTINAPMYDNDVRFNIRITSEGVIIVLIVNELVQ